MINAALEMGRENNNTSHKILLTILTTSSGVIFTASACYLLGANPIKGGFFGLITGASIGACGITAHSITRNRNSLYTRQTNSIEYDSENETNGMHELYNEEDALYTTPEDQEEIEFIV